MADRAEMVDTNDRDGSKEDLPVKSGEYDVESWAKCAGREEEPVEAQSCGESVGPERGR